MSKGSENLKLTNPLWQTMIPYYNYDGEYNVAWKEALSNPTGGGGGGGIVCVCALKFWLTFIRITIGRTVEVG